MKPRYAIVRVDNRDCPRYFEKEINNDFVCTNNYADKFTKEQCKDCRYGDTKEQLILKIMTALDIGIKEFDSGKIPKGREDRRCAEIIVEFLGVEE